jgi:hypothetical protein
MHSAETHNNNTHTSHVKWGKDKQGISTHKNLVSTASPPGAYPWVDVFD